MEEITFWNLITSANIQKICIPTIQRDFAQGRCDRVYLRNNFLNALHEAIVKKKNLTLDFVYGVDNATMFVPLDGQQRLTTLWLLHWYIAYKAGILDQEEVKKPLLKFSYETRSSSTDFCKSLCSLTPNTTGMKLQEWITQQTWFFHHYKQDPTIIGMLNMIAGTDITDKKSGEDIVDGLEEIFQETDDFKAYWTTLTTTDCIKFYKLQINFNDSDELYVKMNARGRQLTDFENFKTELVQHAREILGETKALGFAAKLDVQWTDIFWNNRWEKKDTKDVSIDEIYFEFIRRYIRMECIRKQGDKSPLIDKISQKFTSFEPYEKVLDKESITNFITIMNNLRKTKDHAPLIQSPWGKQPFDFIPKYIENGITDATKSELLVFYGFCKYLQNGEYDEMSFKEWNRVLWNICENRVDKENFLPTIKEIDILAEHSHCIINYLSQEDTIKCDSNKEQLLEEQRKARHLETYPAIKEMERYSFFKGAIRFLYTGANGEEDWNSFETKARNVKNLISDTQARHTIKRLTPYIPEAGLCDIYHRHWVSNNDEDLRIILLDNKSVPYLHNFLLQNDRTYDSKLNQDIIDICEKALGGRAYLQTSWGDESKYIWTNYVRHTKYHEGASIVVGNEDYSRVSMIIMNSTEFEKNEEQHKIYNDIGYIKGLALHFKYENQFFNLYGNNTICRMTEGWEDRVQNLDDSKDYCISTQEIKTEQDLKKEINFLL